MATTFTKNVFPYSGAASVIVAARTTVAPLRKSRTRPKQPKHTRRVTTTRTIDGSFITPSSIVTAASLSVLPTSSLLRSLFINSISSKPFLLGPSIFFLNLLCQSKDSFLFSVDRNKLLGWIVKKTIYKQFCAGENAEEVRNTMKEMKDLGFKGTILTYAKETVFDSRTNKVYGHGVATGSANQDGHCKSIEAWSKGALDTVEMLGSGDQLALKVTGAGPLVTGAFSSGNPVPAQMIEAMEQISKQCRERKAQVLIDAESQHYQAGILSMTLGLMRKFNKHGAVVFNTYQAYLKSTPDTLQKHLDAAANENFTLGLKLVRGAYLETDPRHLIHDTKQDTDDAYNSIAQGALNRVLGQFGAENGRPFPSVEVLLAGHNMESVQGAHMVQQQRIRDGLPIVPLAFAQLHGMSDRVSLQLLQMKDANGKEPDVYKCSTWGSLRECIAYLARRAMENRDAAGRTLEEYRELKAEVWRRLRSAFAATA